MYQQSDVIGEVRKPHSRNDRRYKYTMSATGPKVQSEVLSKEVVIEKLQVLLRDLLKLEDIRSLTPDTRLQEDLGIGSLDAVDLVMAVEDTFSIKARSLNIAEVNTIGDMAGQILERLQAAA